MLWYVAGRGSAPLGAMAIMENYNFDDFLAELDEPIFEVRRFQLYRHRQQHV